MFRARRRMGGAGRLVGAILLALCGVVASCAPAYYLYPSAEWTGPASRSEMSRKLLAPVGLFSDPARLLVGVRKVMLGEFIVEYVMLWEHETVGSKVLRVGKGGLKAVGTLIPIDLLSGGLSQVVRVASLVPNLEFKEAESLDLSWVELEQLTLLLHDLCVKALAGVQGLALVDESTVRKDASYALLLKELRERGVVRSRSHDYDEDQAVWTLVVPYPELPVLSLAPPRNTKVTWGELFSATVELGKAFKEIAKGNIKSEPGPAERLAEVAGRQGVNAVVDMHVVVGLEMKRQGIWRFPKPVTVGIWGNRTIKTKSGEKQVRKESFLRWRLWPQSDKYGWHFGKTFQIPLEAELRHTPTIEFKPVEKKSDWFAAFFGGLTPEKIWSPDHATYSKAVEELGRLFADLLAERLSQVNASTQ